MLAERLQSSRFSAARCCAADHRSESPAGMLDSLPGSTRDPPWSNNQAVPGDAVASSERKLATVLFADLVGSTALASGDDPERVRIRLERFYEAMADEVRGAGGTVEKFAGDAVMAVFGAPAALEDHGVADGVGRDDGRRLDDLPVESGAVARERVRVPGEAHRPLGRVGAGEIERVRSASAACPAIWSSSGAMYLASP